MLTHRYVPYGIRQEQSFESSAMDIISEEPSHHKSKSKKHESMKGDGQESKVKSKKRKESIPEESGGPKKTKRTKQAA